MSARPALPTPVDLPDPPAPRPRVTRYDRARLHGATAGSRSRSARAWATSSAVLAAAGLAAVLLLPQDGPGAVRVDVPVSVVAAPGGPAAAAAPIPAQPGAEVVQLPASDPVQVRIPALGVTADVMHLGLEPDGSMEVPAGAYPVGWYDRSPTPGQIGPSVLAGHVDWEGEPGAFYGLRELLPGDEVVVDRADGTVAVFLVDRVEEHPKDEFPTADVYGNLDHPGLRLITCGGGFDEGSGDYLDNVIVFARLQTTG